MSLSTYRRLWRSRDHNRVDALRAGGKRAANADAGRVATEVQTPLATLPFQIAQVDHCTLPVACEGEGDAILSMLVDQATEEILAWVVLFAPPSSATNCLLLRDCVRRHGRLPNSIYADGGSDFRGDTFQLSLWDYGIDFIQRAAAHPKSGSEIERRHNLIQHAAIRGERGFKEDVKNSRKKSATHSTKARPKQDPIRLRKKVSIAIKAINNGTAWKNKPSLTGSRMEVERIYGNQGVQVQLDFKFLVSTSPFIKTGAKTDPRGAIRWDDRYFTATNLLSMRVKAANLSLRLDPESNGNVIYYYLAAQWYRAIDRKNALRMGISDDLMVGAAPYGKRPNSEKGIRQLHRAIADEQREYESAVKSSATQGGGRHSTSDRDTGSLSSKDEGSFKLEGVETGASSTGSSPAANASYGWDDIEPASILPSGGAK